MSYCTWQIAFSRRLGVTDHKCFMKRKKQPFPTSTVGRSSELLVYCAGTDDSCI